MIIEVDWNAIGDEGVNYLRPLAQLTHLSLFQTKLTFAGLREIKGFDLRVLEYLLLSNFVFIKAGKRLESKDNRQLSILTKKFRKTLFIINDH